MTTTAACAPRSGPSSRSLKRSSRVDASFDGRLELLDVSKVLITSRRLHSGRCGVVTADICQHLHIEHQITVTSERQLATSVQGNGYRTTRPGHKLLTGENPITLNQRSTHSIASYRKNLADNLTDDTDQSSHETFLTTTASHRWHV
jgi:hypothetical protein